MGNGIRIASAMGSMRWAELLEIYRVIAADPSLATVTRTLSIWDTSPPGHHTSRRESGGRPLGSAAPRGQSACHRDEVAGRVRDVEHVRDDAGQSWAGAVQVFTVGDARTWLIQ
jgi:hypothetical protein